MVSRRERNVTNTPYSRNQPFASAALPPANLATLLAVVEGHSGLSEGHKRDLRSAVKRVAHLLGNAPAAILLAMDAIRAGLNAVNPIAIGMTRERFANIRSDFVAAVKASGLTLHHLRLALRLICPDVDRGWLLTITKRIAATAPRKARKHPTVTSEQLYLLGIELIDRAVTTSRKDMEISKLAAMEYRDGLLIALLALFLPRRRTVTGIRIGKQLVRAGELWALEIPPEDTKNKQGLDFPISADMSRRIDVFLQEFRVHLPGADCHNGLWVSNKRRPMSHSAIYDAVRRRTKKAFGFAVNLHRFRHAAGCFWSIQDPVNVRGVKDLLGHASFEKTTEKHYMMGQSRLAGRALAKAFDTTPRRRTISTD
jgi:integrase